MEKISYLKLVVHNEILSVCKIEKNNKSLSVHKNDISVFNEDLSSLKKSGKFQEASRREFEDFYKKTVSKINSFSKL